MYQRTIAVTEYLPPNLKSDKSKNYDESRIAKVALVFAAYFDLFEGRSYSAASGTDEVSSQPARRLLSSSDAFRCSASFGGGWSVANTSLLNSNEAINQPLKSSKPR